MQKWGLRKTRFCEGGRKSSFPLTTVSVRVDFHLLVFGYAR